MGRAVDAGVLVRLVKRWYSLRPGRRDISSLIDEFEQEFPTSFSDRRARRRAGGVARVVVGRGQETPEQEGVVVGRVGSVGKSRGPRQEAALEADRGGVTAGFLEGCAHPDRDREGSEATQGEDKG